VTWLWWLVAGTLLWRTGLYARPVDVKCVVVNVALGLCGFLLSVHFNHCSLFVIIWTSVLKAKKSLYRPGEVFKSSEV